MEVVWRIAYRGGPVAGKPMAVQDAKAYGGSEDKPMAGYLIVHDIV
jgi:hypothetical protein